MGLVIIVAMIWISGIRDEQSSKAGDIKAWYHAEFNLLSTENDRPIPNLGSLNLPYPQFRWTENGENKWKRFDFDYELTFELGSGMSKPENPVVSYEKRFDKNGYCAIIVGSYKDNIYPESTMNLKTSFWVKGRLLDNITIKCKRIQVPSSKPINTGVNASYPSPTLPNFEFYTEENISLKASARVTWGVIRENKKIIVENLEVPPTQKTNPWSPSTNFSFARYGVFVS